MEDVILWQIWQICWLLYTGALNQGYYNTIAIRLCHILCHSDAIHTQAHLKVVKVTSSCKVI